MARGSSADPEVEAAADGNGGADAFGHESRAGAGHSIGIGQDLEFVVHGALPCLLGVAAEFACRPSIFE
jgi:hypothetical protein